MNWGELRDALIDAHKQDPGQWVIVSMDAPTREVERRIQSDEVWELKDLRLETFCRPAPPSREKWSPFQEHPWEIYVRILYTE